MVYNSETNMIEEYLHIKFDDKEPDSKLLELVQFFYKICVSKVTPGARGPEAGSSKTNNPSEVGCS